MALNRNPSAHALASGWKRISTPFVFFCLILATPYGSHPFEPRPCFADQGISYDVAIEGITDQEILKLLREVSQTFALKKRLPATTTLLKRRVNQDIPILIKALKSKGYYDARIATSIIRRNSRLRLSSRSIQGHHIH